MQLETATRARDKILCHLKMKGPLASGALAEILGVTSIAVRQHLQILQDEGYVEYIPQKGKVGRPVHIWNLTEKSNKYFPDNHSLLATLLVDGIRKNFGEEGLRAVIAHVVSAQSESASKCLNLGGKTFQEKVQCLVDLRKLQGYMAECRPLADGGIELIENHCPVGAAACDCDAICESEADVFRMILGDHVSVERCDHILSGDRRCTYKLHDHAVTPPPQDAK